MSKAKPVFYYDITPPEALSRLADTTIKLLKETKIPRHAFVVYEIPKLIFDGTKSIYSTGIVPVNVEDQPGQIYTLVDLESRNGKYCCHGNFPTHNDKDPLRVKKYQHYGDGNGGNPWDELAVYCNGQLGIASEISHETRKFKEEIETLKKQLNKDKTNEQAQGSR